MPRFNRKVLLGNLADRTKKLEADKVAAKEKGVAGGINYREEQLKNAHHTIKRCGRELRQLRSKNLSLDEKLRIVSDTWACRQIEEDLAKLGRLRRLLEASPDELIELTPATLRELGNWL